MEYTTCKISPSLIIGPRSPACNATREAPIVGCSKPERVDDVVAALEIKLSAEEIDFLEGPYQPHALVGPKSRPGEKPLAGTTKVMTTR